MSEEDDEMIWCPSCDEYKVRKCNQPEEVEKRLISEFVGNIERLIEKCENIDRNGVNRCYTEVYWMVKLKREYEAKLK